MYEYNKKIMERESEIKKLQRKIDTETKLYHVNRTKKANQFERAKMLAKLEEIDGKAKNMKEDRLDYAESRKFMVQKLKKDLEFMKAGGLGINAVEKKYEFLRNDKEFQKMMMEVKKELHPGRNYLIHRGNCKKEG